MRVLMLAYHFPPIGGAGVQRAAKLARQLSDLGSEILVVSGPGVARDRWTPVDSSVGAEVADIEVHRVSGPEPAPSGRIRSVAERWLRIDDAWTAWWLNGAVHAGFAKARNADVILATMSPFATTRAAAALATQLDIPWVADLRDPWALDEMQVYPTWVHRGLEKQRMRRALGSAAAIVMNTPEATRRLLTAFPELGSRPVETITNGYDSVDFEIAPEPRNDDRFRIVHAGYLHTSNDDSRTALRRILGGGARDVNIRSRSHVYLMEAIEQLSKAEPKLAERIELHLAGVLSKADRSVGGTFIRERGYLPHREATALLRSADLLFLPMHDLPPGRRATIVPGKTYEYLAAGRRILAAVPDGDARDLLEEAGALVCRPTDVETMRRLLSLALRGDERGAPRAAVVSRYERQRLTAAMAAVLERVIGASTHGFLSPKPQASGTGADPVNARLP